MLWYGTVVQVPYRPFPPGTALRRHFGHFPQELRVRVVALAESSTGLLYCTGDLRWLCLFFY